jgi:hypothetical protein
MLRAELIERGYDAVGYVTTADASLTIGTRFPDLIVVDLRGVTRGDVEHLFQIGVPVIAIVSRPSPDWLNAFPWKALLWRPVSIGEIAEAIQKI